MTILSSEKQKEINTKFISFIKQNDLIGVKNTLAQGADLHTDDEQALIFSAKNGHTEVVNLLLEQGANVHAKDDVAFNLAAEKGHTAIIKLLYDYGANIHADYCYGLREAAQNGYIDAVKMMIINFNMEIDHNIKLFLKACNCHETLDIINARDLNNSISLSLNYKNNNEKKMKL